MWVYVDGEKRVFCGGAVMCAVHCVLACPDVVVDLTLWTENGRVSLLNRRRLAPVTINYLGFPGTSGCTGIGGYGQRH